MHFRHATPVKIQTYNFKNRFGKINSIIKIKHGRGMDSLCNQNQIQTQNNQTKTLKFGDKFLMRYG